LKDRVPRLSPTYVGERRTTFIQAYEEHVGEHIGNLRNILRTYWELEEHIENLMGTHMGNQGKLKKPNPPHPQS
jgi:hypothetical protein